MTYHKTYRDFNPVYEPPRSRFFGCFLNVVAVLMFLLCAVTVGWIEPILDFLSR